MATNVLAPVGRQRAVTDLGLIAPGALLYTYVSGTPSTPLATTSDAAGLVPNTNPIVASAGGLFGPIYVPLGVAYHFRLTDAAGGLIWDQDPVVGGGTGGTVLGDLSVSGLLTITGFGVHSITAPGVGALQFLVRNTLAGATNLAMVGVGNDAYSPLGYLAAYASTFNPVAWAQPNGLNLLALGPGGLSLTANDAAGALRVYTGGGSERLRIAPTGEVGINVTPIGAAQLFVATDGGTKTAGIYQQNLGAGNALVFMRMANSAGGVAGDISQNGATGVLYGTTSDARLKQETGRASDLSALRAVVIHDFTWKADGVRDRGVFAQELAPLFPRAVVAGTDDTTADGSLVRPWMTDVSKLVPDLIVGWQQHDAAIADLRAAVATLHGSR